MNADVDGGKGWVSIRDPRRLTEGQSEVLEDAQFDLMDVPGMAKYMASMADPDDLSDMSTSELLQSVGAQGMKAVRNVKKVTVLVYVDSWSYGEAVDMATLMTMPKTAVDEITDLIGKVVKATGGGPHIDTEPNPDVASPISPSGA